MRYYGTPEYKPPTYYVVISAHKKFQHNMLNYGAPAYKLLAYCGRTSEHYAESSCVKTSNSNILCLHAGIFSDF